MVKTKTQSTAHSYRTLMVRLQDAGFGGPFSQVLLPDWWSKECESDVSLLPEIEIAVARLLRLPIATVRNPALALQPNTFPNARLRTKASTTRSGIAASMHAAITVAGAVVRNLTDDEEYESIPEDPLVWRKQILAKHPKGTALGLNELVGDLWERRIPVIHLKVVPSPKFQGLACIVNGRPVIILAWNTDASAELLFHCAHEAGHIAKRHVAEDRPVFDETQDSSTDPIEVEATEYALALLNGAKKPSLPSAVFSAHQLVRLADEASVKPRIDPGHIILSWGHIHSEWQISRAALRMGGMSKGGKATLDKAFLKHVNVEDASETDRRLLQCVTDELA